MENQKVLVALLILVIVCAGIYYYFFYETPNEQKYKQALELAETDPLKVIEIYGGH